MIWLVFGAMAVATCVAVGRIFAEADPARTRRGIRLTSLLAWLAGLLITLAGKPVFGLVLMALGAAGAFATPPTKRRGSIGSKRQRDGGPAGRGPHVERDDDPRPGRRGFDAGVMTEEKAYQVLGLQPGASLEEIGRAHRTLMKKLHPDQGGSTELAARANAARDILEKRRQERHPHVS